MTRTVMIVESDRELAELIARGLRSAGYRPKLADRAEAALDRLQRGDIELLVVDGHLEDPDAFTLIEALRDLRAPFCDTPVLLSTQRRLSNDDKQRARCLRIKAILRKPVSLERLTDVIEKYAKEPPPPIDESPQSDSHEHFDGPLEGKLREFPLPELLHHIHGLRANGVLMLEAGKKKKALQFRDGYPVAVKSNLLSECLGQHLVKFELISQEQLDESVARRKRGEGMQGEILVAMEVLEEEQVAQALVDHNEEKLFEIFGWKGGSFRFEVDRRLKGAAPLGGGRSPASTVLEGVSERYPIERIDRYLAEHAQRWVTHGGNPFDRMQDARPGPEVRAVLDETAQGRQILHYCRADESRRRAMYAAVVIGLLEVRSSAPASGVGRDESALVMVEDVAPDTSRSERERTLRTELAAMAEKLRRQNFFEMLEVDQDAEDDEIEVAFERIARQAHPDRYVQASNAVRQLADDVFQQLSRASETLRDPRRRRGYLAELKKGERQAAEAEAGKQALVAEVDFQRGEGLMRQREYAAALLCFGSALQKAPEEGEYHAHYGWCLYLCHPDEPMMRQEAVEHVRRGIKLARENEKPYLFLGRLYKAAGRVQAAEKMFNRAVELRPDSVEAMRELRLISMRREKSKGLIGRLFGR